MADIVQDIFVAAASGLPAFNTDRGTLITWLLSIAHRRAALYWRERHRPENIVESWSQNQLTLLLEDGGICDESAGEIAAAVRSVIATLPKDAAMILIGVYLDARTTADMAAELNISEQAVRSRLSRARQRFREAFEVAYKEFVS